MAKIKVKVKSGTKGKPLGVRVAEFKAKEGEKGKKLYEPKAKMMIHFNDGRA
jgi:hypothetical protein